MTRLYDLMLLIDPNAPDGRQDQVMREVQSLIESGGTLVGSHDWGERRLAYEIDHRPEAQYHLFQFESETDLLERLEHQLKIMDGVLRFRIIKLKPGQPTPPPPRDTIVRERREEREPEGRVAARAAADAPPEEGAEAAPEAEAPAEPAEAPAEAAEVQAPAPEEGAEVAAEVADQPEPEQ
jgi:small subunit ribosomal protein S6